MLYNILINILQTISCCWELVSIITSSRSTYISIKVVKTNKMGMMMVLGGTPILRREISVTASIITSTSKTTSIKKYDKLPLLALMKVCGGNGESESWNEKCTLHIWWNADGHNAYYPECEFNNKFASICQFFRKQRNIHPGIDKANTTASVANECHQWSTDFEPHLTLFFLSPLFLLFFVLFCLFSFSVTF